MNIKFIPAVSMRFLNNYMGGNLYSGKWSVEMDREWVGEYNDQLISVSSRLLEHPKFGKIEHAAIQLKSELSMDAVLTNKNSTNVNTELIQYIKDTIFGEKRFAIQIYPKEKNLIDMVNVYHIFIFDKFVSNPFNISKENIEIDNEYQIFIDDDEKPYMTNVSLYKSKVNILNTEYPIQLLEFELAPSEKHIWNTKYRIINQLCGTDVAAIEDYPFNKQYNKRRKTEGDSGHIIVFEPEIDIPFGIHPDEYHYTKYINRGPLNLNQSQLTELHNLFNKYEA